MKKKSFKIVLISLSFVFILSSCSLTSKEEFELQGQVYLEQLTSELKKINDLNELKHKKNKLAKNFNRITQLMISYHLFLEKYPQVSPSPCDTLALSASAVKSELLRLFEIEGAREVIIGAEKEAYLKLTLMEESFSREKKERL